MSDSDAACRQARQAAERAKAASRGLARTTDGQRAAALFAMAAALRSQSARIVGANGLDVAEARSAGTAESLIDRLFLDEGRVESMACAIEEVAGLADPLGEVLERRVLPNGIELSRVRCPLGAVAVIYEARPNVTADAAAICLRSGNSAVLRGGSIAARTNALIASVLSEAALASGMPEGCIEYVGAGGHEAAEELMRARGAIDVLVPRGSRRLIDACVENSTVPVIETGTGNCHVYLHRSADIRKAVDIAVSSKCRRFGVCNAAETLLVDEEAAEALLPEVLAALRERGVTLHVDARAESIARRAGIATVRASEADWECEYLAPDIAVRVVSDIGEALDHIERYGTRHSESIVCEDTAAADEFTASVDAAAVYANASTGFTDGGEFGLGAEIGISTQKLHVRGPFALEGLTTYKYVLRGEGQVRA